MHELSIATSLVEVASAEAIRHGAERVIRIFARIGVLSGVVPEALEFAFDVAASGTPLEGAVLEIEAVPVVVYCPQCRAEKTLPDLFAFWCPDCSGPTPDVRSGREMEVTAMELVGAPSEHRAET